MFRKVDNVRMVVRRGVGFKVAPTPLPGNKIHLHVFLSRTQERLSAGFAFRSCLTSSLLAGRCRRAGYMLPWGVTAGPYAIQRTRHI